MKMHKASRNRIVSTGSHHYPDISPDLPVASNLTLLRACFPLYVSIWREVQGSLVVEQVPVSCHLCLAARSAAEGLS